MDLIMQHNSFDKYLQPSTIIDHEDPKIQFAARFLLDRMMREIVDDSINVLPDSEMQLARITYEYVRDRISHSWDIGNPEVTLKASDVLSRKHGLCLSL